jgi:FkbM family methyltransferase
MRNELFTAIANAYPTHRMCNNKALAAIWRILFYTLVPTQPFIMRTEHYKIMAYPKKGTLTRAVIRRGYWERMETSAFIQHLQPGDLIIDAGANFGHYALIASKFVGKSGKIIAFEPSTNTFKLLQSNIAMLAHQNVIAVKAGLSDDNGEINLNIDTSNPGGHSFTRENVRETGGFEMTPVYSLDQYLSDNRIAPPVRLIKIDVQGFEVKVIRGAMQTLKRDHPVVFCEVTPVATKNSGDDILELLLFFEEANYTAQFIDTASGQHKDVSFKETLTILSQPEREYADLIFIPPQPKAN